MKKVLLILLILLSLAGYSNSMVRKSFPDSLRNLAADLPERVGDWTAEPGDGIYDRETIFDYIDGAGEVYLAYNMQGCLSRRYGAEGETAIVLDIFHMGSSEDAFGVFTHDRDGTAVDVGEEALYRSGWLSFWKGRFFVSIYMEEETAAAREAVFTLGRAVDSRIADRGQKPKVLLRLPSDGLEAGSIRYFHHHMLMNYHFFLSDENILKLGPETDVVLAGYQRSGNTARILLALYPDPKVANNAWNSFRRHYLPEATSEEAIRLEDGTWSASALKDDLLIVVLEAETRHLAEDLIGEAKKLP